MATVNRYHRTALFVDGVALRESAEYRERVNRLNQSLNGPNIKVDIFTVFPESTSGVVSGLATATTPPVHSGGMNVERLAQIGREAGYVQTLVDLPTRVR